MTMRTITMSAFALSLAGLLALGAVGRQDAATTKPAAPPATKPAPSTGPGAGDLGAMLVKGLDGIPGCLGYDLAQWKSGRNTICAWFEDKEAVVRWYHSPMHKGAMKMFMRDQAPSPEPLAHVKDGTGPIMVMATITPTEGDEELDPVALPISQISIELYQPLPGGAHIGGRLAPEGFEVPHMKSYDDPAGGARGGEPPASPPSEGR